MRTSSDPSDRMARTDYEHGLGKALGALKELIAEGRRLRRDQRMVVNVHKYTRARVELLARYRGVTLSTALDEALKIGLGYVEAEILTFSDVDWDEYERDMRELERISQAEREG